MASDPRSGPLTPREQEIVELIIQGHDNLSIAAIFGVGSNTVRRHVYNIFGKKGVLSRLELAVKTLNERHVEELQKIRLPAERACNDCNSV